jgi:hypothetical protein
MASSAVDYIFGERLIVEIEVRRIFESTNEEAFKGWLCFPPHFVTDARRPWRPGPFENVT